MSEAADYRPWNSQAGSRDLLMILDEVAQHCFETGKVLRRINVVMHPRQAAAGSAIQSQMGFGRPDVARQNNHSTFSEGAQRVPHRNWRTPAARDRGLADSAPHRPIQG